MSALVLPYLYRSRRCGTALVVSMTGEIRHEREHWEGNVSMFLALYSSHRSLLTSVSGRHLEDVGVASNDSVWTESLSRNLNPGDPVFAPSHSNDIRD